MARWRESSDNLWNKKTKQGLSSNSFEPGQHWSAFIDTTHCADGSCDWVADFKYRPCDCASRPN